MKKISLTLAALAISASAFAQNPAPAQPAPSAASAPAADPRANGREARIEERIAYLHSHLKITQAQEPQWKTFADTMRVNGDTMSRLYQARMNSGSASALDDMKQYADLAQAHADGAKRLADAFAPLYASFPADQKALADMTFRSWRHDGAQRGHAKGKPTPGGGAGAAPAKP